MFTSINKAIVLASILLFGWVCFLSYDIVYTLNGLMHTTAATVSHVEPSLGAATVLTAPQGGTGLSSFARGDLLTATSSKLFTTISAGATSTVLTMSNGMPTWAVSTGGGSQTLAQVSALGSFATATLQLLGGFIGTSSTVTSTFTVLGDTSLQGVTMTSATATSVTTTNLAVTGGLTLPANSVTDAMVVPGLTIDSTGSVSASAITGGTLTLSNFTLSGTVGDTNVTDALTISGGTVNNTPIGAVTPSTGVFTHVTSTVWLGFATASGTSLLFANGTSTNWFGFGTASGTTVNASAMAVNGSSVCLANGTNCPSSYVTLSVTGSFTIPQGANPTVDDVGKVALDTTDNQFLIGTSTNSFPAVLPTVMKLWGGTVASTSNDFFNGGRIPLPPHRDGVKIQEIHCYVTGGTSVAINLDTGAGGSNTDAVTCGTTLTSDTDMSQNFTISAGGLESLEIGSISGSPNYVSFSVFGTYVRE